MTTYSVNVGSSLTLTVTFTNAAGGAGNFNTVAWSFVSVPTPPNLNGGMINLTPAAPPSSPTNTTTANVSGIYPGLVTVTATPDTNPSLQVTCQVQVLDTSNTPVSGTIT